MHDSKAASSLLLQNRTSRVVLLEEDRLVCTTSDRRGKIVYLLIGMMLLYLSVTLLVWRLSRGEIHVPTLASGVAVFGAAVLLQWFGARRHRQMGTFYLDKSRREIRNADQSRRLSFDNIRCFRLMSDPIDLFNVDLSLRRPLWLAIEFEKGARLRIAKGKKQDLDPVVDWLIDAGLPWMP